MSESSDAEQTKRDHQQELKSSGHSEEWNNERSYSPRKDFIDILSKKVVKIIDKNAEKPIQEAMDRYLPSDEESIRKLPFHNSTILALQYQRNNYLVGTQYAERKERQRIRQFPPSRFSPRMPRDATALGYIQLVNLGSWFIPSETIQSALTPLVISLPSGILKDQITTTVANAMPLAQSSLDNAVKNAILNFIDDPQSRQMVKNRTENILRVDNNKNKDKPNNDISENNEDTR